MSQLRNILGLREEIEIYNVGPGQGADIIIFRFIVIDLSPLVSRLTEILSSRPTALISGLMWFDAPAVPAGLWFTRIFRVLSVRPFYVPGGLADWLTDIDKTVCCWQIDLSVTYISHRKHCNIVKIQTIALISMNHLHHRSHTLTVN